MSSGEISVLLLKALSPYLRLLKKSVIAIQTATDIITQARLEVAVNGIIPALQSANIKKPLIKIPRAFEKIHPPSENVEKSLDVTEKKPAPIKKMQSHHKKNGIESDSRSGIDTHKKAAQTAKKITVFLFILTKLEKLNLQYLHTVRYF